MTDRLILTASVFTRLGAGLLLLIGLARYLDPATLGVVSLALAVGGMWSIVQDFGQPVFVLRQIGLRPLRAPRVTFRAICLKLVMFAATLAPMVMGLYLVVGWEHGAPVFIIFVACTLGGLADIISGSLRALGKHREELGIALAASVPYVALPVLTAVRVPELDAVALSILAARGLHFAVAIAISRRSLVLARWRMWWARRIVVTARSSLAYWLESLLVNGSNQLDVFVLGAMLPLPAFGTYQAGSRFMQTAAPLASILMTAHLPKAASAMRTGKPGAVAAIRRIFIEFLSIGALAAGALYAAGPIIAKYLYLERFGDLNLLWRGFAAAVLLRFAAAAFNLVLTAQGRQDLTAKARFSYSVALFGGLVLVVPQYGLAGLPHVFLVSSSVLLAVSAAQYVAVRGEARATGWSIAPFLLATAAVFGPVVSL